MDRTRHTLKIWFGLLGVGLVLASAAIGAPRKEALAQNTDTPVPSQTYLIRKSETALAVTGSGEPVLAFAKAEDYCKYVLLLLEKAGDDSGNSSSLADGFATRIKSLSPVTVIEPITQECGGANVYFYKVKVRDVRGGSDLRQPVYILRGYVIPPSVVGPSAAR